MRVSPSSVPRATSPPWSSCRTRGVRGPSYLSIYLTYLTYLILSYLILSYLILSYLSYLI